MENLFGVSFEWWEKGRSPLLDSWPLFGSPLPIASILFTYLIFVLHLGPKFMKNRKPFNLKIAIILYNALQVCYNAYGLSLAVRHKLFWKYLFSFNCFEKSVTDDVFIYRVAWIMTMNKLLDLVDTIFFVLCKKQSHVSFLHVQHHFLTLSITWAYVKYFPIREIMIAMLCNTIVHTVMYFYYFLAALGPAYKKYLWWKKYLTVMQIVQFVVVISYLTASIWLSCDYNMKIVYPFISYGIFNLFLFVKFFVKTYNSEELLKDKVSICGSLQFSHNYTEDLEQQHGRKGEEHTSTNYKKRS
ncbi:Elongation of very long chain fatty acids protein 7 [Pseudolycoriella hygida]|uniref:Elongation of very long chain fatty acids protein n=1 Tax=Pseudolycoriella hygida TaxID=35572 RepID=A0A9Q0RVU3_9DIPT|nr:Elongation of very long chain fatty acids protein 7 [Pseudolycoriella hygida]